MHIDLIRDLEADIETFMQGDEAWQTKETVRPRRYASDGFAQGMMLDRLETQGFHRDPLPSLDIWTDEDGWTSSHGCRFTHRASGRSIQTYHADGGVALATAALMALRHGARLAAQNASA